MKLLLSIVLVLGFVACSSTKKDGAMKENCAVCSGSENKADCACEDHKAGATCEHGTDCKMQHAGSGHEATALPSEAWALDNEGVKGRISQEDFNMALSNHHETLNKSCVTPAQKYCGKVTKDMALTEAEVVCLYSKVNRVTREKLPTLDGSACAKHIKAMTPKPTPKAPRSTSKKK